MEERRTVIAEKQEEIYGEYGYQKAYQNIQGQFNRICEALGIDSGEDEASILKSIGEMVETMIDDGEEGGGKVKLKVGKTEKQQGAGGKMTDWAGRKLTLANHETSKGRVVACANEALHKEAIAILSKSWSKPSLLSSLVLTHTSLRFLT
mgnify:CR=1 FL=1